MNTPSNTPSIDAREELRNYICRVAFGEEYDTIWDKSVARIQIDGIMADLDQYATDRVIEELNDLWTQHKAHFEDDTCKLIEKRLEELNKEQPDV